MEETTSADETQLIMKCMLEALNIIPLKNYSNTLSALNANFTSSHHNDDGTTTMLMMDHQSSYLDRSFTAQSLINDCMVKSSPKRPYELSWEHKSLWAILFSLMLAVAIVGNCIVIWIVLGIPINTTLQN